MLPYGVFSTDLGPRHRTRIGVAISCDYILDCSELSSAGLISDLPSCMQESNLDGFLKQNRSVWRSVRQKIKALVKDINDFNITYKQIDKQQYFTQAKDQLQSQGPSGDTTIALSQNLKSVLVPRNQPNLKMHLPCTISDYTDFFTSPQHACRGNWERLRPNWKTQPIAYHGRSSSIIVGQDSSDSELTQVTNNDYGQAKSDTDYTKFQSKSAAQQQTVKIHRPNGQYIDQSTGELVFGPSQRLDYEVEVGCIIGGQENPLGQPLFDDENLDHQSQKSESVKFQNFQRASERIFGFVLLNDLSARDIQYWEMQPLGPFLGKSFATVISPWIVPKDALDENPQIRKIKSRNQKQYDYPESLKKVLDESIIPDYLRLPDDDDEFRYVYDIPILSGIRLRQDYQTVTQSQSQTDIDYKFYVASQTNLSAMHWSFEQLILHHTSNGCNLRPGDLLGSGTLSMIPRSESDSESDALRSLSECHTNLPFGCLQELTNEGQATVEMFDRNSKSSIFRKYLLDEDECVFYADSFGECAVQIVASTGRKIVP